MPDSQTILPAFTLLERHMSSARLAPFLSAVDGNYKKAVHLYHWNVSLSGAAHEALHMFEVTLRNALDRRLCDWNATQTNIETGVPRSRDWIVDPAPLIARLVGVDDLEKAIDRARRVARAKKRSVVHADMLAQISFGTWRFMMPDKDPGRVLLWRDALSSAFPRLIRDTAELTGAVTGIADLRNRVAHMEPLLNSVNVRAQYNNMRQVLGEIDPAVETLFVSNQRITSALKARPTSD